MWSECPACGLEIRMRIERNGPNTFLVASCADCNKDYVFRGYVYQRDKRTRKEETKNDKNSSSFVPALQ